MKHSPASSSMRRMSGSRPSTVAPISSTTSSSTSFSLKMRAALIGSPTYFGLRNRSVFTRPPRCSSSVGITRVRHIARLEPRRPRLRRADQAAKSGDRAAERTQHRKVVVDRTLVIELAMRARRQAHDTLEFRRRQFQLLQHEIHVLPEQRRLVHGLCQFRQRMLLRDLSREDEVRQMRLSLVDAELRRQNVPLVEARPDRLVMLAAVVAPPKLAGDDALDLRLVVRNEIQRLARADAAHTVHVPLHPPIDQ